MYKAKRCVTPLGGFAFLKQKTCMVGQNDSQIATQTVLDEQRTFQDVT